MQLPEFEFRSIVGPYAPSPTKELGAATQALRADYEGAIENQSKLAQAKASMRAATPYDQEVLNTINSGVDEQLAGLTEREDLENTLSQSKKLLSDYTTQITPIAQRTQQFDELSTQVMQRDPQNAGRIMAAVQAIESNPETSTLRVNPQTGTYANTLNPSSYANLMAPTVNLSEKLNRALAGVKANSGTYAPTIAQMTGRTESEVIDLIKTTSWEEMPDDVIEAMATSYLEGDSEAQAYRQREETIASIDPELGNNYEAELDEAIKFATGKYGYKKTKSNYSQLNTGSSSTTRGGKSSIPTLNTYGVTTGLSTGGTSIKDLRASKKELDKKAKDGTLTSAESVSHLAMQKLDEELHGEKGAVNKIAKDNGWTAGDIELYMDNLDRSNEDVDTKAAEYILLYNNTRDFTLNPDPKQRDAVRLKELREQVDNFAQKEFGSFINPSYENAVVDFSAEGADEITRRLSLALHNYEMVIQNKDGSTIKYQDYINSLSREEKEKIEKEFETKPTSESLKQMLTATGVTTNSLLGFDTPAIRGKFTEKYNDILGEEVYFVPKNKYDSELFTFVDQYLAKDARTDGFRARNSFGNSGLEIESQFNAMRQFEPEAFKGKKFNISSPLLDMQIESDGQAYIATMTAPDGSTKKVRATTPSALSNLYFVNARKFQLDNPQ